MLALVLSAVLGCVAPDEAGKAKLAAAVKRLEAAENFTFTFSTQLEDSAPGAEDGANGAKIRAPRDLWTVKWSRRDAWHYVKGRAEFWRHDQKIIALGRADTWIPVEVAKRGDRDDASSRRGRGTSPEGAEGRGITRMVAELQKIAPPHRFLADVLTKLADVTATESDGVVKYQVVLPPEVARKMLQNAPSSSRREGERAGGAESSEGEVGEDGAEEGQAGAPPPAPTAEGAASQGELTVRFEIQEASGQIRDVELWISGVGPRGSREMRRRYTIRDIGTTKAELPESAAAVLYDQ